MSLQFVAAFHYPFWAGHVSDSPACHGIGFGNAVDDDGALLHAFKLRDAFVASGVVDVLVDFVGDDEEVFVSEHHFGQCAQLFLVVYASRRVAGRTEDEHSCFGGDGCFELSSGHLEVLFESCGNDNGVAAGKFHHLWVAYPIGSRDDHFVAVVDQCQHRVANTLFGTVGNEYFGGGVVKAVFVFQFGGDGLAQTGVSGYRRIFGVVVVDGLLGACLDAIGCVEIWLADTEIDDVDALCFHLAAFLRHDERCRRCESV